MPKNLLLALAFATACGAGLAETAASAAGPPAVVEIHNFHFLPDTLTVAAGTTVIWANEDSSPHTVTDRGNVFRSAALDTKESFSYTFTSPGEFTYFCKFHPMMVGTIIVKPAGSSS